MKRNSRRINPNRIMLGMMPRACDECKHIQHVFFKTQQEYDEWDCPVCNEKVEPDDAAEVPVPAQEDEVQPS